MTAKQAYKKINRTYEKEAFDFILEEIRKAHNLKELYTSPMLDENGNDFAGSIVFGYDNSDDGIVKAFKDFQEARTDVIYFLKIFGLTLQYECNGNGDGCFFISYRICD